MCSSRSAYRLACVSGALLVAMIAACRSDSVAGNRRLRAMRDGVSRAESLAARGRLGRARALLLDVETCTIQDGDPDDIEGCTMSVPGVSPSDPWLEQSGGIYEPAQTDPISIKFSGPVHFVALVSDGALKCSGASIGRVVGYLGGSQVASVPNALTDSTDCGEDDVTFGVTGGLDSNAVVDSLVIQGVDPWTFDVEGASGRALLNYTITFVAGWPCGGSTADARDSIRTMYDSTVIFTGQPYKPACSDFVSSVSTSHFTWAELSSQLVHSYGGSLIGVFSATLLGPTGIDSVRGAYGAALTLNSTYRDPRKNYMVGSTAKNSPHMHGTATDIATTSMTWQAVHDSAGNVPGARVLSATQDPSCSSTCVHVDWP